jgi:hypothetical protein
MTSIEWLKKELEEYGSSSHLSLDWSTFDELIEQAKEMHKVEQEISDEMIKEAVISFNVPDGYKVEDYSEGFEAGFEYGAKWYCKQIKSK